MEQYSQEYPATMATDEEMKAIKIVIDDIEKTLLATVKLRLGTMRGTEQGVY